MTEQSVVKRKRPRVQQIAKVLHRDKYLIMMSVPGLALLIIFKYIPIYGIVIAFQEYDLGMPFFGRDNWVGLAHFIKFVNGPFFSRLMRNTFLLGFYGLAIGFPLPIVLALAFNEIHQGLFKRVSQTVSYLPYFVSTVVIIGLLWVPHSSSQAFYGELGSLRWPERVHCSGLPHGPSSSGPA